MTALRNICSTSFDQPGEDFLSVMEPHKAKRRPFWFDVIRGVALAFDPLPAKKSSKTWMSDQTAFDADIAKLVADRLTIEPSNLENVTKFLRYPNDRRTMKANGENSHTLCEAD